MLSAFDSDKKSALADYFISSRYIVLWLESTLKE